MTYISPDAQRRQQAARQNNGRFGEQFHSVPETSIDRSPSFVEHINESFPVPQANSIESVGATVSAVASEVTTPGAVADALGVHERQGGYYLNAAGYLGLVEQEVDYEGGTGFWRLTALGDEYHRSSADERASLLMQLAESTPAVAGFRESGIEGASDAISERGELSEETILRRARTASSWAASIDAHNFSTAAAAADEEARARFSTAADRAKAERVEYAARRTPQEPQVCAVHFITLPTTGICDMCEM